MPINQHARSYVCSERGALHLFALIVVIVSIAEVIYLRHLLDELDSSRSELSTARQRIEQLESRLGKIEQSNLRTRVEELKEP